LKKSETIYNLSLLLECKSLRTGASDLLPPNEAAKYCGWLMMRLESWTYSSLKYDALVRKLVEEAVNETLNNSSMYQTRGNVR